MSATDPKGEHQAKGREGAGRAWQVFPQAEVPPGVLERDPLPASRPSTLCAGQEPLLRRVSPRQHSRTRDCACLSTPSPTSSWQTSLGKLLSLDIKQHQGGRHLPVPLGFCVAVPRGWDQLCLSPNLKAMWTSLQESPRPSPGVNTSSLTTPRRFSTACAFTLLFISPPQGSVQFLPRGIRSAQIMQCLAKDTKGPSVLSLLTSTGHPSLGTLPTLSVEIGSKHSCPKGPDLTRPHETPCPQGQQTRHKPKAPVA